MATLISKATGNFTDSTKWAVSDTTSELDSEAASTATTTAYVDSAAFTPGAITLDGILLNIASKTSGGTFTVCLRVAGVTVPGTEVAVNVADVPANGRICITFSSVLLVAATVYTVAIKSSTAGTVTVFRNATAGNWSRCLRTTTTAAPGSGDTLHFAGEHTGAGTGNDVTITNTNTATTTFGSTTPPQAVTINKRATFLQPIAASGTPYFRFRGTFQINDGGLLVAGTSGGRMAASAVAVIEFDSSANVDTGLIINPGGTARGWGDNARLRKTLLNTDEAVAQTVLGIAATTGWSNGDVICIGPTNTTTTQFEKRTITTVDSSTQVTVSAGLTYAHSGTSPVQAFVGNLTGNVIIRGIDATHNGYIWAKSTSVLDFDNVEFYNLGSGTAGKEGIRLETTTGSASFTNCPIHDFTTAGACAFYISLTTNNNITIQNNVIYNMAFIAWYQFNMLGNASTSILIDGNYIIGGQYGIFSSTPVVTITNNRIAGFSLQGLTYSSIAVYTGPQGACSGNTIFSTTAGFVAGLNVSGRTISTLECRRCSIGANVNGATILIDPVLVGNVSYNLFCAGHQSVISNPIVAADSTVATSYGFFCQSGGTIVLGGSSGVVSGINRAHGISDIYIDSNRTCELNGTILASSTEMIVSGGGFVFFERKDGTTNVHGVRSWLGSIDYDSVTYKTAAPSMKLSPLHAYVPWDSAATIPGRGFKYQVSNGQVIVPRIWVRKDSSYNGSVQPEWVLKANPALGQNTDVVLDTLSVAHSTWEELYGSCPAATEDGVWELVVRCRGTAGTVNVDDRGGG